MFFIASDRVSSANYSIWSWTIPLNFMLLLSKLWYDFRWLAIWCISHMYQMFVFGVMNCTFKEKHLKT